MAIDLFFLSDNQEPPLRVHILEGSCKISQPDRLRPDGCLIEIPNRRLNQENLHDTSANRPRLIHYIPGSTQLVNNHGNRLLEAKEQKEKSRGNLKFKK